MSSTLLYALSAYEFLADLEKKKVRALGLVSVGGDYAGRDGALVLEKYTSSRDEP
jgi:hypothetical protein